MSVVVTLRTAVVALDLEHRPERAVNGARGYESSAAPTQAQVLLLSAGDTVAVLIGADLIWFASDQAQFLRAEIARRTGAKEEAVVLCASHTHGTPNPDRRFAYGEWSKGLVEDINGRVLDAVDRANEATAEPVRVVVGRAAVSGVAINRRRVAWLRQGLRFRRRVQSLPDPSRWLDDRVTVFVLMSQTSGRPVALVVHFSCHPVADPSNRRGADFPGLLRQELHRRFGIETSVVFLQGFCGDVRPALLHRPNGIKDWLVKLLIGDRFRPARNEDAIHISGQLAASVEAAIKQARPIGRLALHAKRERIALSYIDNAPTGRDLDVTIWRWSDDIRLIFASAEMLSGLAPSSSNTLAVGYANGMAGYIAPAADYAGGGYEIDGFLARFGLAKRFDPGIGAAFAQLVARM